MKAQYLKLGDATVVFDGDRLLGIDGRMFEPSYWEARQALAGQASGRGTTWFVKHGDEQWALRHYRRGGWIAKFVTDHYLWLGLTRTRAWREWHLTAELHAQGLPVPVPVAARVIRDGLTYRADFITQRIPDVEPLSQRLQQAALSQDDWHKLGALLRRFHVAGLDHADLNAHNILLDRSQQFWLIDFDKSRLRTPGPWQEANLARLQRSLHKLKRLGENFLWKGADWTDLKAGYDAQPVA